MILVFSHCLYRMERGIMFYIEITGERCTIHKSLEQKTTFYRWRERVSVR
jgi:hypothetical protein